MEWDWLLVCARGHDAGTFHNCTGDLDRASDEMGAEMLCVAHHPRRAGVPSLITVLNRFACELAQGVPDGGGLQSITVAPALYRMLGHQATHRGPEKHLGLMATHAENQPQQLEIWTQAGCIIVREGREMKTDVQEVASAINAMGPGETRATSGVVVERPLQPGTAAAFVAKALEMDGKPYIFGAEVDLKDESPRAFDCSELVQWACAQVGVKVVDGARLQYLQCDSRLTLIDTEQAMLVRGALLFRIPQDKAATAHVAISLGDGRTIEARGKAYGVGEFSAEGRGWTAGALVPGMRY
jgi:cell wall-associated NlpC family hydrolase